MKVIFVLICCVLCLIGISGLIATSIAKQWQTLAISSGISTVFLLIGAALWISCGPIFTVLVINWEEGLISPFRRSVLLLILILHIVWTGFGFKSASTISSASNSLSKIFSVLSVFHLILSIICSLFILWLFGTYASAQIKYFTAFKAKLFRHPIKTSEANPLIVSNFPENALLGGNLCLTSCPGKQLLPFQRDIEIDLNQLHDRGCDTLITLLEPNEMRRLNVSNLIIKAQSHGFNCIHFPIHDKWMPKSMKSFAKMIEGLSQLLDNGKHLCVHCCGGKGRSGLVAAALLMWIGAAGNAKEAIQMTKSSRKGALKNPLHQIYLHRFYTLFNRKFQKMNAI